MLSLNASAMMSNALLNMRLESPRKVSRKTAYCAVNEKVKEVAEEQWLTVVHE